MLAKVRNLISISISSFFFAFSISKNFVLFTIESFCFAAKIDVNVDFTHKLCTSLMLNTFRLVSFHLNSFSIFT